MTRMLIGETQKDLASALQEHFSVQQYTVEIEEQGFRILECLRINQYDILLLETSLPGVDGIQVVQRYRASGGTAPIVLMSGSHCSTELERGLDAGADSYIVKPFRLRDLGAQLRALLRRPFLRSERILASGSVAVDTEAGTVTKNDVLIHLHPMEFKLLQFFLRHPNQVFSQHAIFERVWQKDTGRLEDTVRTHIRTLRRKIDSPGAQSIITTVRGLGYKAENKRVEEF
ncbi:MAG: response regulator transcription factor [Candidatus Obscuribacterales bacterium]|nr:response regulator transcription factor [Candidatus Obscuribacterales bacterium]